MSAGACPPTSLRAGGPPPRVLDDVHEDRLSLRSSDPLRVNEPTSPAVLM